MVYEQQLEQIEEQRRQVAAQRGILQAQRQLLQNPNLLRKQRLGYLLGPAGKARRLAALQELQMGDQQLTQFETEQLNPAEEQIKKARGDYEEAQRQYERAQRERREAIRDFVSLKESGNIYGTEEYLAREAAKRPGKPLYISPKTGKAYGSFEELQKAEPAKVPQVTKSRTTIMIQEPERSRGITGAVVDTSSKLSKIKVRPSITSAAIFDEPPIGTENYGPAVLEKRPGSFKEGQPFDTSEKGSLTNRGGLTRTFIPDQSNARNLPREYQDIFNVAGSKYPVSETPGRIITLPGGLKVRIPESFFTSPSSTEPKKNIVSEILKKSFGIPTNEKPKTTLYYDNIPIVKAETKAVEVGTGRIATQARLNTRNAILEDHYFVTTPEGKKIDVGIFDPSKQKKVTEIPGQDEGLKFVNQYIPPEFIAPISKPSIQGRAVLEPQEPQLTVTIKDIPAQQLPGVIVRDFTQTLPISEQPKQPRRNDLGMSSAFEPPSLPDLNFDFNTPQTSFSPVEQNPLLEYLSGLKPNLPIGKPAEPELLPPVLQTPFRRAQDLALNLPPAQLANLAVPYLEAGYNFALPYVDQYIQNNPFVQTVTLSQPLRASKEQVQAFAQRNAADISRITRTDLGPYLVSGAAELIPTTPIGVIGTVGGLGAASRLARGVPYILPVFDTAIGGVGAYQYYTAESPEQQAAGIINVGLGATSLGISGVETLRRPVALKIEPRPITDIVTKDITKTAIRGEELLGTETQFTLKAQTPSQSGFYAPRYTEYLRRILGVSPESFGKREIADLTFEELKIFNPSVKRVEISPAKISISRLPPSVVKDGRIDSFILTAKATTRRTEPFILARFSGETGDTTLLRLLNEKKIDQVTQKNLELIQSLTKEKSTTKIPFETRLTDDTVLQNALKQEGTTVLKRTFFPETELTTGDVLTLDILKRTKTRGDQLIPPGRRIRRGRLASVEKSVGKIEYSEEFGLKEYEKFLQRLSFVDTTYPRFAKPRRAQLIRGESERLLYELPEEGPATIFTELRRRPLTPDEIARRQDALLQLSKQIQLAEKRSTAAVNQAKVAAALKYNAPRARSEAEILKQLGVQRYPTIVGGQGTASVFAAQGTYERNSGGLLPKEVEVPQEINRVLPREISREVDRQLPRNINREISRDVVRDVAREIQKEVPREIQREIPKFISRTITRPIQKPNENPPSPTIFLIPQKSIRRVKGIALKRSDRRRRISIPSYTVLLKRRGLEVPIARGLPRGRALRTGVSNVQKELSRQFRIVESGVTDIEDISFRPRESQFRQFVQRRGQRSSSPDRFIQKISNSLDSSTEKYLIAQARRRR